MSSQKENRKNRKIIEENILKTLSINLVKKKFQLNFSNL